MFVRKEEEKDYNQVFELIEKAFENEEYSDHREQFLVERLRAVLPNYQGNGIGGHLIEFAHKKARELGFESIILLGHPTYYPKFGYRKASDFDIKLPFDVPVENCMAIELVEDALKNVNGMVEYPKEFYQ